LVGESVQREIDIEFERCVELAELCCGEKNGCRRCPARRVCVKAWDRLTNHEELYSVLRLHVYLLLLYRARKGK